MAGLVITKKVGSAFGVGASLKITIIDAGPTQVRLRIEAPRDVEILREYRDRESPPCLRPGDLPARVREKTQPAQPVPLST